MKMKNLLVLFTLSALTFTSCLEDECTSTRVYNYYEPVMMHESEFRTEAIEVSDSKELKLPGKLYFYKNYLLINDQGTGIHFYDITNDENPVEVTFFHLPGNFDMAINNDVLYADVVVDILAIDISDILNPKILNRAENYKDQYIPQDGIYYAYSLKTERTEIIDCSNPNFGRPFFFDNNRGVFAEGIALPATQFSSSDNGGNSGVGGSFARFTISKNHLYTVDNANLNTWNIDGQNIEKVATRNMGWGIETIYPFQDYLFIGSNSGMFIYNNEEPTRPTLVSTFTHASACDPVVTDGKYAYVTLRDGTECQGYTNQLEVVDITNIKSPKLVDSYPMVNPHGLSVVNDYLFVGEGQYGFKILDKSNPENVKTLSFNKNIKTYDVIALSEQKVFIVGDDGFYIAKVDNNQVSIKSSILIAQE
jgi:hypothetical protein